MQVSKMIFRSVLAVTLLTLVGCSGTYYSAMESMGIHKRDIMVDRVEAAQKSQVDAQEQFASALDQFDSVIKLEETDLKIAYEELNSEYEQIVSAADDVSTRINKVESVADALFDEWTAELEMYKSASLRSSSKKQLNATKTRYAKMMSSMRKAEGSMEPVLATFQDNVLFLKHNLNAQAIGSLKGEFGTLKSDIDTLIKQMNTAITSSNSFIKELK